jgi:hypothetical protein
MTTKLSKIPDFGKPGAKVREAKAESLGRIGRRFGEDRAKAWGG